MYNVTQEYEESIKQPIRNRSYMRIMLGLINQEAQTSAAVENQSQYTGYSDFDSIFIQNSIGNQYATYEQDYFKADGSMYFLPRNPSNYRKNGIITNDLFSDTCLVELSFGVGASDIKGLTIQFGECYPTKFSVILSTGEEFYFENNSSLFETDTVFENTESITIKITEMSVENNRVRIFYIKFGLGIEYDNEWIVSTSSSSVLSAINEDLPETNVTITLKNEGQRFDVDNPASEINFLESEQNINIVYGYEVEDGNIEWMQLHNIKLSDWSSNDTQATIMAVDRFKFMSDSYYKGRYYDNGISLYDLAVIVLEDAGIESEEYYIDTYLKDIIVHNPLPNVSHKEALQIIANAGRCILDIDRYGKIRMYSSFIPDYEVTSNGEEYYANTASVNEGTRKNHYASYARDYWSADGDLMFVPRSGIQDTGYISNQISKDDGTFEINPVVTIDLEAKYKCFGIKIIFSGNLPKSFIIRTYADDVLNETITITENIKSNYELFHEFQEFNKMELEFTETQIPNNRIQIDYISFGSETNYVIEYDDMYDFPEGTQLEKVKKLNVSRYIYTQGSQVEELINDELIYNGSNQIYYFSEACYGYSASIVDGTGTIEIVSNGAYYVEISLSDIESGANVKISVSGKKYNVSETIYTIGVNNRGVNKSWNNPLISDSEHCKDVAGWIADYYTSGIEYTFSYRGDPALECGDTIYQENRYVENLKTVIEEHQLEFNGAIKGSLRTRRKERVDRA